MCYDNIYIFTGKYSLEYFAKYIMFKLTIIINTQACPPPATATAMSQILHLSKLLKSREIKRLNGHYFLGLFHCQNDLFPASP